MKSAFNLFDFCFSIQLTDKYYFLTGVVEENFMVLSFVEKSKLTIVNFSKKISNDKKDIEKLSSYEPKVGICFYEFYKINFMIFIDTEEFLGYQYYLL